MGTEVRFVHNGVWQDEVIVGADPFTHEVTVTTSEATQGEDRWRAEVLVDKKPRTVTSHLWLRYAPGPDVPDVAEGSCGCKTSTQGSAGGLPLLIAIAGAAAARLRARRSQKAPRP
jgi:hypothetical protein